MTSNVRKVILAAVTVVVISAGAPVANSAWLQANRDPHPGKERIVEASTCLVRAGAAHENPMVLLRVDGSGRVIGAATNTGCAPRHGDDVFYVRPDGTVVPAPAGAVDACDWVGDFTAADGFQPQHCGRRPAPSGPPHRRYSQPS